MEVQSGRHIFVLIQSDFSLSRSGARFQLANGVVAVKCYIC